MKRFSAVLLTVDKLDDTHGKTVSLKLAKSIVAKLNTGTILGPCNPKTLVTDVARCFFLVKSAEINDLGELVVRAETLNTTPEHPLVGLIDEHGVPRFRLRPAGYFTEVTSRVLTCENFHFVGIGVTESE